MNNPAPGAHVRQLDSLLAMPEKRALERMARRLPPWVSPDQLTLVGLLAMLGAGAAYGAARWHPLALLLVVPALAANWLGDSLDGTLARVRRAQRPRYGFYVDHVVDLAGAALLLSGLALSTYMSPLVALGLLAAYLLVSAELYLATHTRAIFRLAFWRVGPTELRIILAAGTLYLLRQPSVNLGGTDYLLFDVGGVGAAAGLVVAFIVSAARNARALSREETLPR